MSVRSTRSSFVDKGHRKKRTSHHHHLHPWVAAVLAAGIFGLLPLDVMRMELIVAQAAYGYEATVSDKTVNVTMQTGETRTVILTYKNTGSKTWYRDSAKEYVSLYLVGSKSSPLNNGSWRTADSLARIADAEVKPGGVTTVRFTLYAPSPGTYTETLRLASEDTAWMYTAETKLTVTVRASSGTNATIIPAPAPTPSPPPAASSQTVAGGPTTILLLRSARELSMAGSQRVQVTLGFKNTGASQWSSRSLKLAGMYPALSDPNTQVYDETWTSRAEPVRSDTVTNPGEIGFLSFWLKTPARKGDYRVSLSLEADGKPVEGGLIDIPITVTADGNIVSGTVAPPPTLSQTAPRVVGPDGIAQAAAFQSEEPIIRVGIFATVDDQMIISADGPFRVHQKGSTVCSFLANQDVTIHFDRVHKVYTARGPGCQSQSSEYYHVQRTDDPNGPLRMTDFNRPVSWLPGANDNTFRSILELRWSPSTDAVWTINELPIEMYLRGIAETSDVSPIEYQKALLTAARTYAMYHWTRATKHANEFFHVDAKYDQVYRGYGAEARSPKIVQAVTETRGQIVTYNGELAITPYYSRSDGRTRDWTEVWGGSGFPWLVSVPVPQDAGRTLWGHGVGLSASGALGMANEGSQYRDILKHFYQGTDVMRFY